MLRQPWPGQDGQSGKGQQAGMIARRNVDPADGDLYCTPPGSPDGSTASALLGSLWTSMR